jgi:hypothetical protein
MYMNKHYIELNYNYECQKRVHLFYAKSRIYSTLFLLSHHIYHFISYTETVIGTLGNTGVVAAYKLNILLPPHFAVPVVAAPMLPLQISVQAFTPVKLEITDEPKFQTLPP